MKTKSNWQKPIAIKLYKSIKNYYVSKTNHTSYACWQNGNSSPNVWKILNSLKHGKLPSFNIIIELETILEIKIITFFLIKKIVKNG